MLLLRNVDLVLYSEKVFCWKVTSSGVQFRKILALVGTLEGGGERQKMEEAG